jgi:hypothetical protein
MTSDVAKDDISGLEVFTPDSANHEKRTLIRVGSIFFKDTKNKNIGILLKRDSSLEMDMSIEKDKPASWIEISFNPRIKIKNFSNTIIPQNDQLYYISENDVTNKP